VTEVAQEAPCLRLGCRYDRPAVAMQVDLTGEIPDLAPSIFRQRLLIEALCREPVSEQAIRDYLSELSDVCGMTRLIEPVTHRSDQYGWAGWIHWETSGAHLYAWDQPELFLSVDIYTCKPFDPLDAIEFTKKFFDTQEIVGKLS
jgi:S-adenosylmethionine/arginine decarboxylase-like enzyme